MDSPSIVKALGQTVFGLENTFFFKIRYLKWWEGCFRVCWRLSSLKLGQNQFEGAYNNTRHRSHAIVRKLRNKNKKTQRSIWQETQAKVRHI